MSDNVSREDFESTVNLRPIDPEHTYDQTLLPADFMKEAVADVAQYVSKSSNKLVVKEPIAEGGMGVIHLGEQGILRREVAIKILRKEFRETRFVQRLLREARVTGLVEHPNIVPVYALELDEDGVPMIVMKKIEGVEWRALIRDPAHPAFPKGEQDALAWHLRVLMRVCDAVHYAHSRGILHLDLKPDNVMIGAFREVYLVDWGVACSMREEHRGFLPMADEVAEVVGTPAYMAPEMVNIKHANVGVFSDVYLLGSLLYEVLTGKPPHHAKSVQDALFHAYQSKPLTFPKDTPSELKEIVAQAMDPNPERRHQSAEDFRSAIASFLQHRGSRQLGTQAERVLGQLRMHLEELSALGETTAAAMRHQRRALRMFGQCRFGFAQALRQWPENPSARAGLVEALTLMAQYHVSRGDAAAAEALLDDIEEIEEELIGSLGSIRESIGVLRKREVRRQRIAQEQDHAAGRLARARYVLWATLVLSVPVFGAWWLQQRGLFTYEAWHSLAFTGLVFVVLGVAAVAMGAVLMPNRASRRFVIALVSLAGFMVMHRIFAYELDNLTIRGIAPDLFLFGVGAAMTGIMTDRRLLITAAAFLVASMLCLFQPAHGLLWVALASLLGPGLMAYLWLRAVRADPDHGAFDPIELD